MPQNKEFLYSEDLRLIADTAKVIGHPERVRILFLFQSEKKLSYDEIFDRCPLSRGALSQHIRCLIKSGFILGNWKNNAMAYRLNESAWKSIPEVFSPLLEQSSFHADFGRSKPVSFRR